MILNPEQVQAGVEEVAQFLVALREEHGDSVEAGGLAYLSHERALWATKKTLWPEMRDEHMTQDTWEQLEAVTLQALSLAGYSSRESQLKPPLVPFDKIGRYHRRIRLPDLPQEPPNAWRQQAIQAWDAPEMVLKPETLVLRFFWNEIPHAERTGLEYDDFLANMTPRLVAFMQTWGWTVRDGELIRPLPFDDVVAGDRLATMVQAKQGHPLSTYVLFSELSRHGYGREYRKLLDEPTDAMLALVRAKLPGLGYETEAVDGFYRPRPVALPEDVDAQIGAVLDGCRVYEMERYGEELLLVDELNAQLQDQLGLALSTYQFDELLKRARLVFMRRGWSWRKQEVHRENVVPQPEGDDHWLNVLPRANLTRRRFYPFHVVNDMPVKAPVLVTDDEFDTIVIAHLLGAENAVKSNWAALVGGGKVNAVNGHRVKLSGMKQHVAHRSLLPCKWLSLWLVHKAASVEHVDPLTDVVYVLSDATAVQPPATFFPMLDTILPIPLQAQWAEYLWVNGRDAKAIQSLQRHSYGLSAWRLYRDPDQWQDLIERGLRSEQIRLEV